MPILIYHVYGVMQGLGDHPILLFELLELMKQPAVLNRLRNLVCQDGSLLQIAGGKALGIVGVPKDHGPQAVASTTHQGHPQQGLSTEGYDYWVGGMRAL